MKKALKTVNLFFIIPLFFIALLNLDFYLIFSSLLLLTISKIKRADLPAANSEAIYSRMQTERYMASMWQTMREDIAADRNVSIEKLNDLAENASIVSVSNAVKNNLIDATKYRDEVLSIIAKKIKVKTSSDIEFLSFSKYAKERFYQDQTLTKGDAPNIAVILA